MITVLLQSLITLAAVALGWFLNEKSRTVRENKAAIGKALTTLLFFRRRLAGIRIMVHQLGQKGMLPPDQESHVQAFLNRITPRFVGWEREYDEAVSYLAGVNPILAMDVRNAGMRVNFVLPAEWPSGSNAPAGFAEIESRLADPKELDDPITWLAKLHGKKTHTSVLGELKAQDDPALELSEMFSRLVPFAQPGVQPSQAPNGDTGPPGTPSR